MLSTRGIFSDIKESDYQVTIQDIKFYFTGRYYMEKFKKTVEQELIQFNKSANMIYKNKYQLNVDKLALIRLYKLIERRGFRIEIEGVEVDCLEKVLFVSEIKIVN